MSIIYNQKGIESRYGADGFLESNWDPDKDYGNEYVKVHFRLKTNGFDFISSKFLKNDNKNNFIMETEIVFSLLGWQCKQEDHNGICATWTKGKQHLYLYPNDFSGEVLKNEVKQIAESLEKHKIFSVECVDIYETVYDMTDEEYECVLLQKDEEITKTLLEKCKTNRTYKFYYVYGVVDSLCNKFGIKQIGKEKCSGIIVTHIEKIIKMLITEGYLVTAKNNEMIRTINKTEQKQRKLFVA